MRYVLLGPPGAGKGTQAAQFVEEYGVVHISTGDIFRSNIKDETELGLKVKSYLNEGKLVPDDLTIDLVWDRLDQDDAQHGFLLDGFPRTIAQAEAFDAGLEKRNLLLDGVIRIEVDEDILIRRLAGRRICSECGATYHVDNHPPQVAGICDVCGEELIQRADDSEDTVKGRIDVYKEQTSPLIDYYREKGVLIEVDGSKSVEEVFEDIQNAVN